MDRTRRRLDQAEVALTTSRRSSPSRAAGRMVCRPASQKAPCSSRLSLVSCRAFTSFSADETRQRRAGSLTLLRPHPPSRPPFDLTSTSTTPLSPTLTEMPPKRLLLTSSPSSSPPPTKRRLSSTAAAAAAAVVVHGCAYLWTTDPAGRKTSPFWLPLSLTLDH